MLGADQHVVLTADAGPARRYRDFLAVARGAGGSSSAPARRRSRRSHDLGLVVIWDDGDDLHAEPRAPYPHAREILLLRAEREGDGRAGGRLRAQRRGGAAGPHRLGAPARRLPRGAARPGHDLGRGRRRARLARDPLARAARLPSEVHPRSATRSATGPVLVQTPRSGYAAALACERCRTPARCRVCPGRWRSPRPPRRRRAVVRRRRRGLGLPGVRPPRPAGAGAWGRPAPPRSSAGRSPGAVVRTSAGDRVLAAVDDEPAIVVATPGAEPVAEGGYAAVVLLDTWLMLGLAHLRAEEEALRRWANAVGLVRPGGRAVAVGDPAHPALQALVRWDPAGFAAREAEQRREAHLPPASRLATITGEPGAVDDALTLLAPPAGPRCSARCRSGPTASPGPSSGCRAATALDLSRALGELQRVRSARKLDAGAHPGRPADPVTCLRRRSESPLDRCDRPPQTGAVIQPIRLFGDPVLRQRAVEVVDFDKELRKLVEDLTDTMLDAPGAGLAAPQIGVGLRVFTWYVDGRGRPPGQPGAGPVRGGADGPRAACRSRA